MATMHRLLIPTLAITALSGVLNAQQLPQISQYQFNDYLYNTAVAGSRPWFEMRSVQRNQWVGITDAPRTFVLSAMSPLGEKMGVGGYLYTDIVGPTRRTGMQLSYAYHLRLNDKLKLGLSVAGGMQQWLVDGSKITLHDQGDPVLDSQLRGSLMPDASFSALLYHERYWFGVSVPQLMQNTIYFYDDQAQSMSQLEAHYYVNGGYRFVLDDDWKLEPSFLLKYVSPVPAKIDATVTVKYKDTFWLAGTYRTNDAISIMAGAWVKRAFQFGYAYDITTTGLKNYSSGTHEVMLAITFGKKPRPAADPEGDPAP